MSYIESYPVLTRTVVLSHPYLKQWSILEAISSRMGCRYNHHQPQVVSCECKVSLPVGRQVRVKGHAFHPVTTVTGPQVNLNVNVGTYLVFHCPEEVRSWRRCVLVLNGVQDVTENKTSNSKCSLHLISGNNESNPAEDVELRIKDRVISSKSSETSKLQSAVKDPLLTNGCKLEQPLDIDLNGINLHAMKDTKTSGTNVKDGTNGRENSYRDTDKNSSNDGIRPGECLGSKSLASMTVDFQNLEERTFIVEEEDNISSDEDSDGSEDIHKITRKRHILDIRPMFSKWLKCSPDDDLFVLLLSPTNHNKDEQAWQFLSAWLMISDQSDNFKSTISSSTLTRSKKKLLPKNKPIILTDQSSKKKIISPKD